jgi:alanine dehydrogenase
LSKKKITAFSYEHIRDYTNSHPVMQSLSEITGTSAIMIGSKYLGDEKWGRAKMLGGFSGVNPSEIVLIGAGVVNQYAAKAAIGLGATVKLFDNNINKLRNVQNNLNQSIYTSILHPQVLSSALETCDLAIGAMYAPNGNSVNVVSEEMVQNMKEGSVIIDVSIDKGGCFSTSKITSHKNPVYKKYGVTHYCVPNIPARTPRTSSIAMSNHFGPMIYNLCLSNGITDYLQKFQGACAGIYLFNGRLTFEYIAEKFKLPYYNLELMIASMG